MAHQMLTDQKDNDGLGVFLQSKGRTLRFSHNGRDNGFDASLTAYAETGQGAAIMINLNENSDAVGRIMEVIAESYQWPDYPRAAAVKRPLAVRKKAEALAPYQGYYEFSNNNMIRITAKENKLIGHMNGGFFDDFLPAEDGGFFGVDLPIAFVFEKDARGRDHPLHAQILERSEDREKVPTDRPAPRRSRGTSRPGPVKDRPRSHRAGGTGQG